MLAGVLRRKPDVMHVHGIWSAATVYGRAASLRGVPVVVSPRGMLDSWILGRKPRVKQVHARLFERPLFAGAYLHALNEPEHGAILDYMPELAPRTFTVPNGIPAATVELPESGRTGFLFIGRLHEKKQTLELIAHWKAKAPAGQHLTIAGWGAPDYDARIRQASAEAPNVTFVGPTYGAEKTALLARHRWFILPSLSEGLPMAALEALQHGCIPILTRECNLPELFRHNVAVEVQSNFSDWAGLVERVEHWAEPDLDHLSRRCVEEAALYSWDKIAASMALQYRRAVEG